MIHSKKKKYIRPEAETTWMESDEMMQTSIQIVIPPSPWDAKGNKIGLFDNEDPEDDGWGLYFGCNFEE